MPIDPQCFAIKEGYMLRAFLLALQSLSDKRIISLMLKSIGATLALLILAGIGFWLGFDWLLFQFNINFEGVGAILAVIVMLFFAWLFWRMIAITVIWFFADDIVEAVEDRHYPLQALTGSRPDMRQSAVLAGRSVLRLIGYNLLASPVYLILLFTGVGTALALLLVNSLLLGRDLEDMIGARHGPENAPLGRLSKFMLGMIGTAGMLLPFVNLFVPVIAVAMAVHMAHDRQMI